jgi:hypothetical protein
MKNIHVLPTDRPSRLFKDNFGKYFISINIDQEQNHFKPQNIYITNSEEIKEGMWFLPVSGIGWKSNIPIKADGNGGYHNDHCKKIILTTDQDLITDGVQAIDDDFLEWFVNNPSCEFVRIAERFINKDYDSEYVIIIPQEEPKQEENEIIDISDHDGIGNAVDNLNNELPQETSEEAAELYAEPYRCPATNENEYCKHDIISAFNNGAKWQSERMYSEEEVKEIIKLSCEEGMLIQRTINDTVKIPYSRIKDFTIKMFEQFKKK